MRDSEVVASIVAGDPDGLAQAYDRYAHALFGYCSSLLPEPADAADAVQDTFVIAASRLSELRDPELLRPWLYAVARNECLRRLKSREAASGLSDDERADESVDVAGEAERAQTRALLRAAVDGLNPAERDVITAVLHGLDVAEIATVLAVSRNHAHSLFSRARQQLEASVGVLIVARTGRQDCRELDALLTSWDGRLTARMRKQVGRHIVKCPVCSERRRRALTPAMLLGLSPGALVGAMAAHAAATARAAPAALRDQSLRIAAGNDLHAQAYRSALESNHGSFRGNGFPKPLRAGHHVLGHLQGARLATTAAGAAAAAAAIVLLVPLAVHHHALFSGGGPPPGAQPNPGQPRSAPSGAAPGNGRAPGAAPGRGGTPGAAPSGAPSGGSSVSRSPEAVASSPEGSPSPARTATPAASASPTPTPVSSSPTAQPTPSGQPTQTPPPGTLAVSTTTIVLTPALGQTITLTAENGAVTWSITEPASLIGELNVSPSSGTLAKGQSVPVTITVTGLLSLATQLTVNPGGQQVTVLVGLG